MKIKNASCTCSTLRSFQRIFAQQAARGRLSTAVNIVTLPSGSVAMPLASALRSRWLGSPHLGHVPIGALRQKTFQRFDVGVSLSILRQRVQDTLQTLGRTMAVFSTWTRFSPLSSFCTCTAAAILKPSSKRNSSVTGANICGSSAPMMNCPLLSASRKRARASPDMLSGPEHFLKDVGPQIAYLLIAVSHTDLTGDAQPVTRRSTIASMPFASLESRFFFSYLRRVVPPVTRRKFNCTGLARKSIFGQQGTNAPLSTMTSCGIPSTLQRVMKPTIAITDVDVDIGQIIFDGLVFIGCQAVDLIMARNFCQLCPIRCRSHLPYAHALTKN